MAKSAALPVLVIGRHPSAFIASAILARAGEQVVHAAWPAGAGDDAVCLCNPELFSLNDTLGALRESLPLTPVFGITFLGEEGESTEFVDDAPMAQVTSLASTRNACKELAKDAGVDVQRCDSCRVVAADEQSITAEIDGSSRQFAMAICCEHLPGVEDESSRADAEQTLRVLSVPPASVESMALLESVRFDADELGKPEPDRAMPLALNLRGKLWRGWMMQHGGVVELSVLRPATAEGDEPGHALLRHWHNVLVSHGRLPAGGKASIDPERVIRRELPLAAALSREVVVNRALLAGPGGGFYTALAEDLYSNCWSAVIAAEVARKAIVERFLQDALQAYRQEWGATLGDYLRGPQQNLQFLLPLVYKNEAMTRRLAEAVLLGKSVVR